jgi:drug/metabolite transporter (DMT)-like permease
MTGLRLALLVAFVMVAFAANSVLNRMAVGPGLIDPLAFAGIRLGAGALVLAALVLARRAATGRAIWPGWRGRAAGVGGLLAYLIGFSLAYVGLDAGTGALILFGTVQVTMFAAALATGEPVPARRATGAALAFAGLAWLLWPTGATHVPLRDGGAMVAAGIGWGVYSLAGRRERDALAATAANFVLAVPVAALLALPLLPVPIPQPGGIALAIASGAVTSGLGYALWYAVLPRLAAAQAAVAQLTVPVIAAAGGLIWLAEPPTLRFALASVLVFGGVALASAVQRTRSSSGS